MLAVFLQKTNTVDLNAQTRVFGRSVRQSAQAAFFTVLSFTTLSLLLLGTSPAQAEEAFAQTSRLQASRVQASRVQASRVQEAKTLGIRLALKPVVTVRLFFGHSATLGRDLSSGPVSGHDSFVEEIEEEIEEHSAKFQADFCALQSAGKSLAPVFSALLPFLVRKISLNAFGHVAEKSNGARAPPK